MRHLLLVFTSSALLALAFSAPFIQEDVSAINDSVDNVSDVVDYVKDAVEDVIDEASDGIDAANDVGDAAGDGIDATSDVGDAAGDVIDAASDVGDAAGDGIDATSDVGDAAGDVIDAANDVGDAAGDVIDAANDVGDATGDVIDAASDAGDAAGDVIDAASDVRDAAGDVIDAANDVVDATGDVLDSASETDKVHHEIDSDEDGNDVFDPETEIGGIPLKLLTNDEINYLLTEEDNQLIADLDISVAAKVVRTRNGSRYELDLNSPSRKKRWISIAGRALFGACRALFRGSRASKTTTRGSRVTRHYNRPGNYNDARRDFNRFNPGNRNTFRGPISGQSGTVGKHRITVRDGSSAGRPTLEIRTPKNGGTFVRKFRYDRR